MKISKLFPEFPLLDQLSPSIQIVPTDSGVLEYTVTYEVKFQLSHEELLQVMTDAE